MDGQWDVQAWDADVATHYDLGVAYLEMGMISDAIMEFDIAARGPAYAAALAKKGEALLALEQQAKVARQSFGKPLTPEEDGRLDALLGELETPPEE